MSNGHHLDTKRRLLRGLAAAVVLFALFLPLFTVRYLPPGGSGRLYGHRVDAFVDRVTGLQFATTAHWTHVLPAIAAIVGIGIGDLMLLALRSWAAPGSVGALEWEASGSKLFRTLVSLSMRPTREPENATQPTTVRRAQRWLALRYEQLDLDGLGFLYSAGNVLVAIGWLLIIGLVVLIGVPSMPPNGEKGLLPAFQSPPSVVAHPLSRQNWVEPVHMTASLGAGWLALLLGVAIGIIAMRRQVAAVALLLLGLLIALRFLDRGVYDGVSPFLIA